MIDPGRLEALILARLSVNARIPPSLATLTKSLHPFVMRHVLANEWQAAVVSALKRLRTSEQVDPKKLSLTEAGKTRLAKALGLGSPPATRTWSEFKKTHLRVLLGHASRSGRAAPPLSNALVARELGLPTEEAVTEAGLANAFLAKALSLRNHRVTLGSLKAALLAQQLGVPVKGTVKEVMRLAAPKVVGATSAKTEDLMQALAYRWLTAEEPGAADRPNETRPDTERLSGIVRKVRIVAHSPDAKRFGANKVFIGSVWQRLREDPDVQELGEAGFKRLLIEAHQRGDLSLSRADLVAAMDPQDVAASETQHLNAIYHFIQVSGDHS